LPDAEKDGNIVTKPKNRSKRRFFIRIEIFPKINILSSTSEFTTYFFGRQAAKMIFRGLFPL
ncbi:MAG: hypothetical protein M1292_14130, partial [Bacteroidetes bacterium]|nr:hypothetical protein [Bacteroidota bacterium]